MLELLTYRIFTQYIVQKKTPVKNKPVCDNFSKSYVQRYLFKDISLNYVHSVHVTLIRPQNLSIVQSTVVSHLVVKIISFHNCIKQNTLPLHTLV